MSTIKLAQGKWENKVNGTAWKSGVTGKGGDYCDGVAEFLGVSSCNPSVQSAFTRGVDRVSANDFDSAVKGKGSKWARRYAEKMGGGGRGRAKEEY
ncbi:MAG: hypothetical protein MUP55_02695 [Candidatus Aenigmarchaeota archaeon]|nr:hypothetical protein [Candidatus Aenigmarchaeota archaeon]